MKKPIQWIVNNEIEANLLKEILNDRQFSFRYVPHSSHAFGNFLNLEAGFGHFEVSEDQEDEMEEIFNDFRSGNWEHPQE